MGQCSQEERAGLGLDSAFRNAWVMAVNMAYRLKAVKRSWATSTLDSIVGDGLGLAFENVAGEGLHVGPFPTNETEMFRLHLALNTSGDVSVVFVQQYDLTIGTDQSQIRPVHLQHHRPVVVVEVRCFKVFFLLFRFIRLCSWFRVLRLRDFLRKAQTFHRTGLARAGILK